MIRRRKGRKDVCPLKKPPASAAAASLSPADLDRFLPRMSLLAVGSCGEELIFLKQTFRETCWELREAHTYRDALTLLCYERMPIVICQCRLPDGDWRDVLSQVSVLPDAPRLIVTSPEPDDRLWAEVFNLGGFDVLTTPFDENEVVRVVSRAWQSWETEWSQANQRWRESKVIARGA